MPPVVIEPAGVSPAGLFVAQTFADPSLPPGILCPARDPKTKEYLSISRGMDPIDDQVITAMTVRRASGVAVLDDGNEFSTIESVTEAAPQLIDSVARRALARLVTNGDIAIRTCEGVADPDDDFGELHLRFANLRAKAARERVLNTPGPGSP